MRTNHNRQPDGQTILRFANEAFERFIPFGRRGSLMALARQEAALWDFMPEELHSMILARQIIINIEIAARVKIDIIPGANGGKTTWSGRPGRRF